VQVSGSIYPGIGLSPASTYGGAQYGLGMWYMLYNNNWFWVQNNANADGGWIGYYPSWLFFGQPGDCEFSALGALAEWVGFWGEVGTASSDPQADATQMGSGERAEAGWTKAAFQKNLFVQIGVNGPFWQQAGRRRPTILKNTISSSSRRAGAIGAVTSMPAVKSFPIERVYRGSYFRGSKQDV
jgi:Neprosin